MNKYIDAKKLKKSIGNYAEGAHAALNPIDGDADYYKGKIDACKDIQEFIDSLQQEQPEELHFTPLNRLIKKIPSENWNDTVNNYAKKLRDCLIKEGYLKDAKVLQDYISYMNGNNVPMATMNEQEQPASELLKQVRESLRDSILAIIAKRGILQPDGSMRLPVYRPDGDNVGVMAPEGSDMGQHLFADVDTVLESDGALIVETADGGFDWDALYTDDLEALLEHLSGMNDEDYQEAREYAGEDE